MVQSTSRSSSADCLVRRPRTSWTRLNRLGATYEESRIRLQRGSDGHSAENAVLSEQVLCFGELTDRRLLQ